MTHKTRRKHDRNACPDKQFFCENIFKAAEKQPYLDSTQGGKWGRGKDDFCTDENEYPDINNPLPR